MASEQKVVSWVSLVQTCKDQLLINKLLIEYCNTGHRSLRMALVDYQKAYDSVPHSWLLRCLQLNKIIPVLCRFLSRVIKS